MASHETSKNIRRRVQEINARVHALGSPFNPDEVAGLGSDDDDSDSLALETLGMESRLAYREQRLARSEGNVSSSVRWRAKRPLVSRGDPPSGRRG